MPTKYSEVTSDLLAYQLTIIKASQRHDGLYWRANDTCMNTAASGNRKWTKLDTDITPDFSCNICDSSSHTSVSCPLKLRKQPLSDSGRPNPGGVGQAHVHSDI